METLPTRQTHCFCERCGELIKISDLVESIYGGHCNDCFEAIESEDLHQTAEDYDADWSREMAMEAGMLHGIDAYNDARGCSCHPYDPDED
jgi:hypothetical protein